MNLVYFIIRRYFPGYIGNEDLVQEGMIGLIRAVDTWDESVGKFSTLASICIRNSILHYFRRENKQPKCLSLDVTYSDEYGNEIALVDTLVGHEDVGLALTYYDEFYESLDDVEKQVLELSLNHNQVQIADILGLSQTKVCRIKKSLMKRWRRYDGTN